MNIKRFIETLIKGVNGFKLNTTIGHSGFQYKGINHKDAFGSPGGSWDPKKDPAFVFSNNDEEYLIRLVWRENKIVIESNKQRLMIINYELNNNNFKSDSFKSNSNSVEIRENYKMTVKHPIARETVKKALQKVGMNSNIIYSGDADKAQDIIAGLIHWADKRSAAKDEIRRALSNNGKEINLDIDQAIEKENGALNAILYGPPGTGKTYSTIDRALVLLGEDTSGTRESRKTVFTEYQKKGRIFFCSFHQNFSYEDFIEGIKPMEPEEEEDFLKYEIRDGLFMRACIEATYSYLLGKNKSNTAAIQHFLDFNALFDQLFEEVSDAGTKTLTIKSEGTISVTTSTHGNFAIRHEGKDKTYSVSRDRLSILYEKFPNLSEVTNISNAFRGAIGGCNATAYWSVLNKLHTLRKAKGQSKDKTEETLDPNIGYEEKKSIVKKYWTLRDTSLVGNQTLEPYVFIIDEINRGNVSQIFGELITLIEDDKRIGKDEALFLDLPYSKHPFGVPPNLHIIGTMNTADRSVEALDTALRRRFSFVPMMPNESKLKVTTDGINLSAILTTMNNRLRVLKDNDHTIGHAWFWNVTDLAGLQQVFANKVLPLLQEYFYNDYEKLGLLLGDAFFEKQEQISSNIFANFSGGNGLAGQYEQSWQYELKAVSALTADDFKTLEQ